MIEQFVNFVIRPPRSEYNPDQYLWETEFILAGRKYKRLDLELTNARGLTIKCSHYVPSCIPENTSLPCVIYCHGNSGCRADANEAAVILLPANITVFTLDFSGSGLSGGDYVSLGWHEKEDLRCVVSYLRTTKQVSCIGLWGRSMGAVTSLLYGAEDSSIAGMVLDSAFTNLYGLMMELVDVYKIRVPKFTVKMAVQYMRKIIQKRAKFDIMDLNVLQFAPKTFIPALFGHASNDMFIQPHHCDRIHQAYGGDKSIIKFEGDHNSPRPQSYYDSVSMFFYNTLHPPQLPVKCSNNLHMGAFKVGMVTNESLFFEIISGLRGAGTNSCSSSIDASKFPNATTPVVELLSESVNQLSIKNDNDLDFLLDENHTLSEIDGDSVGSRLQDKSSGHNEESCSCTSSNRESWGRCSSLGGASDDSFPGDISDKQENMTVKALATPLRQKESKLTTPKTKEKKIQSLWKKLNRERAGVGDSLSQRLKMCLSHSSRHKRA
uniref:Serine aminopeptidase S33 domain-containing protein n=1 Tax=Oryza punctata TaxID=4537 RepID=A0A0E0JWV8_ORYPU